MALIGLTIIMLSCIGLIISIIRMGRKLEQQSKENNHPDGEFKY